VQCNKLVGHLTYQIIQLYLYMDEKQNWKLASIEDYVKIYQRQYCNKFTERCRNYTSRKS